VPDKKSNSLDFSRQRQLALSRWDSEGGLGACNPRESAVSGEGQSAKLQLTNNEFAQLRVRMIAMENLVIALLAEASDRQLDLAREMAAYISPRPGFTRHPLTIHAAAQMINLVERAGYFKGTTPS
jgi:hypothetical protein